MVGGVGWPSFGEVVVSVRGAGHGAALGDGVGSFLRVYRLPIPRGNTRRETHIGSRWIAGCSEPDVGKIR